jgi:hypothetical protein
MNSPNYFQIHPMFQIYELQIHLVVDKIKYTIMLSWKSICQINKK